MAEIYLALGSNVGDSRRHINQAVKLLGAKVRDIKKAPVYRSKAVGYTDQPDFLNTAIYGQIDLSPKLLFDFIKELEQKVGRQQRFRWGPREIDIDIIFYDDKIIKTVELTIPHPRFHERDFVLRPLLDLNAGLVDPVSHQTVKQLYDQLCASHKSVVE